MLHTQLRHLGGPRATIVPVGADRIAANGDFANKIGTYEKAREIAINEYIVNYISMGLKPCKIYFQSENYDTQSLSFVLSNETTDEFFMYRARYS